MRTFSYYLAFIAREHQQQCTDPLIVFKNLLRHFLNLDHPKAGAAATASGTAKSAGTILACPPLKYSSLVERLLNPENEDLAAKLKRLSTDPAFHEAVLDPNSELCHLLSAFFCYYFTELPVITNSKIYLSLNLVRPFEVTLLNRLEILTTKACELPAEPRALSCSVLLQVLANCTELVDSPQLNTALTECVNKIFAHLIKEPIDSLDIYTLAVVCRYHHLLYEQLKLSVLPHLRKKLASDKGLRNNNYINIVVDTFNLLDPLTIDLFIQHWQILAKQDAAPAKDSKNEITKPNELRNYYFIDTTIFIARFINIATPDKALFAAINNYLLQIFTQLNFENTVSSTETGLILIQHLHGRKIIPFLSVEVKKLMQTCLAAKLKTFTNPIKPGIRNDFISCLRLFDVFPPQGQTKLIALLMANLKIFYRQLLPITRDIPHIAEQIKLAIQSWDVAFVTECLLRDPTLFVFNALTPEQRQQQITIITNPNDITDSTVARLELFYTLITFDNWNIFDNETQLLLATALNDLTSQINNVSPYHDRLTPLREKINRLITQQVNRKPLGTTVSIIDQLLIQMHQGSFAVNAITELASLSTIPHNLKATLCSNLIEKSVSPYSNPYEVSAAAITALTQLWDQIVTDPQCIPKLWRLMNTNDSLEQGFTLALLQHLRAHGKFDPRMFDQKTDSQTVDDSKASVAVIADSKGQTATASAAAPKAPASVAWDKKADDITRAIMVKAISSSDHNTLSNRAKLVGTLAQHWDRAQYLTYNAVLHTRLMVSMQDIRACCWLMDATVRAWHGSQEPEWQAQKARLQLDQIVETVECLRPVKSVVLRYL